MKVLFYISLFLLPFLNRAQSALSYSAEDYFLNDSIEEVSHSAIKPYSRLNFSKKNSWANNSSTINLFAGPSLEGFYREEFKSKLGLFAGVEGVLGEKFYYRLDVLSSHVNGQQELYNSDLQNYSFLENTKEEFFGLDARGRLSFTPNEVFNFQVGIDNNFIGEGDRSLLLSDHGNPYPFGQIRTRFWHVEFMNLFQFLSDDLNGNRIDKFAATHYLSWDIGWGFNLGIFESVVFRPKDVSILRGFELDYLNPIQFYRPTEYNLGSSDNVLLGVNISSTIGRNMIYGQLVLDEFFLEEIRAKSRWWANKYGVQLGVKGLVKKERKSIYYLSEFNLVRPFTFTHLNEAQNYGHNKQTLAHPLGANFCEIYGKVGVQWQKLNLELEYQVGIKGGENANDTITFGEDVYAPYVLRDREYDFLIGGDGARRFYKLNIELSYAPKFLRSFECFVKTGVHVNSYDQSSEVLPLLYGGLRFSLRKNTVGSF